MNTEKNESVVSAPGTIQLGANTYLVNKPNEKDVFAVFANARKEAKKKYNPIREALDAIKDLSVSEDQKTSILLQAHRVQAAGEVPDEAISEYISSPKGCAFYAWILIRKNHPEVKLEDLQKLINDDNCVIIFAELDEASGANLIHKSFEASGFFHQP